MKGRKEVSVSVKDIHKEFILPQNKNTTFKKTIVNIVKKNNKVTQKVLDGVSFDVYKGDFLGIIGRNGSGKSTLLKLIAGVYTPTSGSIEINGDLTPFIELGVGFNPELSGRDNVYLNGALLGFNRKQMDEMYDDIVAFAELEPYMDQKLHNYSSGMQVRLAFSIATRANTEILMLDEVLAVGDANFQQKCLQQFRQYKKEGRTIILVTHSMDMVEKFCNRAIMLKDGKIFKHGNPSDVAFEYTKANSEVEDKAAEVKNVANETGNKKVVLSDIKLNLPNNIMSPGDELTISADYKRMDSSVKVMHAAVGIYRKEGIYMVGADTKLDRRKPITLKNNGKISLTISNMPLLSGDYVINIALYEDDREYPMHFIRGVENFTIIDRDNYRGLVKTANQWRS